MTGKALPRVAAALCLLLVIGNGAGWLFGIDPALSLVPGFPKMVPATALLIALGAGSLLQLGAAGRAGMPAALLALLVVATSALIGALHLAGYAPPPFELPVAGREHALSLSGSITAGMFLVLGLALFALARQRHVVLAQSASIGLLLLCLLNLAGYGARGTSLYLVLPGRGTSILTTLAVVMLALGALFARPREGIMRAVNSELPSAPLVRRMLLAAFAVPVLLGAAAMAALHANLSDPASMLPLMAWSAAALFTTLVWRLALQLRKVDMARERAQQELNGVLDQLKAEHERKDIFLATLAHELRNPLAPIRAAADVLALPAAAEPERLRHLSAVISRQVDQLVRLVDDLMDVSRVSRGQVTLDMRLLDMHRVIEDAGEQVRPLIERKQQRLRIEMAERPLYVSGDHQRLVQVAANLLNNAAKYTPSGGTLTVSLSAGADDVTVRVQDNGSGIDPALLPRVFDVFTQADPDGAEGGLGLGLALVRRLTELHGGTVSADSPGPGQGSTFTVRLPRASR